MAQEYVEYTTSDGDRWDLIANFHYQDPWLFEPIIRANPRVPIRPVLPGGIKLLIPVRAPVVSSADMPPWKRGST
jgi:hypothetical protein